MPLNINIQQILLHLFNFVLLFAILYFLLYKPVRDFMEKRAASVQKMHDDAAAKLAEAEGVKAAYTKQIDAVQDEIKELRAQADLETAAETQKKLAAADKQAEAIIADAHRKAEAERNKILKEANSEIAELADAMAEKVVTKSVSDAFDDFLLSAERGNDHA